MANQARGGEEVKNVKNPRTGTVHKVDVDRTVTEQKWMREWVDSGRSLGLNPDETRYAMCHEPVHLNQRNPSIYGYRETDEAVTCKNCHRREAEA